MLKSFFSVVKDRANSSEEPEAEQKISVPKDFMIQCPHCKKAIFSDDFRLGGKVCPHCNFHARLTAKERISVTVDPHSFTPWDDNLRSANPIDFPGYLERIAELEKTTGLSDGIVTGSATIQGTPCVIGVMDTRFIMASMGSVAGEKITRAFEKAAIQRLPVIFFTASGGARMQEGIYSLMQMAKTSAAVGRHSQNGQLYISVMTDPTTGGVAASFAALGDIILSEPKALIGFAGRRVIEGTLRQKLPENFQSAEFFLEHGFIDRIVPRNEMRKMLGRLLRFHNPTKGEII